VRTSTSPNGRHLGKREIRLYSIRTWLVLFCARIPPRAQGEQAEGAIKEIVKHTPGRTGTSRPGRLGRRHPMASGRRSARPLAREHIKRSLATMSIPSLEPKQERHGACWTTRTAGRPGTATGGLADRFHIFLPFTETIMIPLRHRCAIRQVVRGNNPNQATIDPSRW